MENSRSTTNREKKSIFALTISNVVEIMIDKKLLILVMGLLIAPLHAMQKGEGRIHTVVIDPGHGGKDPGTSFGNYKEKHIVLAVAKVLKAKIKQKYPNLNVLLTRTDDRFVPLDKRASLANKSNGSLFISLHVNAFPDESPSGTEVFILGTHKTKENFDIAKNENSVITLEKDYSNIYEGFDPRSPESYIMFELSQNLYREQSIQFAETLRDRLVVDAKQRHRKVAEAGFIVLYKTATMPSVLVELGYITNVKDRRFLISKEGQKKLATAVAKAFFSYKEKLEKEWELSSFPKSKKEAPTKGVTAILIAVSSRSLALKPYNFKGLKRVEMMKRGRHYYYYVPTKRDKDKRLYEVRKKYADAYLVKITDNGVLPLK